MPSTAIHVYDGALRTAEAWLNDVVDALDTTDRHAAHRALRAWLHTVRDRMPITSAADFAAQLPEILRGVFFEGWRPEQVPVKYDTDECRRRFAHEALIDLDDVPAVAAAVAEGLRRHVGDSGLASVLALLPPRLRVLLGGEAGLNNGGHA